MGRHRPGQDHTLENLLDLDGDIYVIDETAGYWVKFVVRRVTPGPERPHGIEYSLTMHDSGNRRLVGFDNAHPVPGTKRTQRGTGRAYDHRHRLGKVKPYPYERRKTGCGFLGSRRRSAQAERGQTVTTLRVGIATYQQMKERTLAIAQGKLKSGPHDPKVWFTSTESMARILSAKNRELLEIIRKNSPQSLAELAEQAGRKKPNLSRTLKTMEHYGLVKVSRRNRRLIPKVEYQRVAVVMELSA